MRKIPKVFLDLDKKAGGIYTDNINVYPGLNMKSLIRYCKKNNINPENLTDREINNFTTKEKTILVK